LNISILDSIIKDNCSVLIQLVFHFDTGKKRRVIVQEGMLSSLTRRLLKSPL